MKGYEIYESAMLLLGYVRSDGAVAEDDGIRRKSLTALNYILTDLGVIRTYKTLAEDINLSENQLEALTYGVAMLLSLGEGDREKNEVFTRIYNAKRSHSKSSKSEISDTLPRIGDVTA